MRMDEIGWHHIHDAAFHIIRPEGAGDWLFLLIKTPCRIDGQGFAAGTMILYTAEHPQDYGADGVQYVDDWMHFEPDESEKKLLSDLQIPLNTPITLKNGNALSKLLHDINFEFYSAHQFRQEVVNLQFRMLLFQIAEQITPPQADLAARLQWIQQSIYRKPFDNFTAARFAAELSVTPEQFETAYQAQFGIAFEKDIRRSILGYGKKHMQNGDVTDEEAAQLAGYADTQEFLRDLAIYYPE
ncbi:MAG: hypothetical protein ACI4J3_04425 [Oscillospiraceae bacterium]